MSVCPERLGGGLQIRYMQVRFLSPTPNALVSLVVEVRFCNPGVAVRFRPRAPYFSTLEAQHQSTGIRSVVTTRVR